MSNSLLNGADRASSCSNNQVANSAHIEFVNGQQSNSTSVNKDISVSTESPINLCFFGKSLEDLGKRKVEGSKIETVTVRKSLPTEIQEGLFDFFEKKEVAEQMQRFRSPKRAIEYVLEGIKNFSKNIGEKLEKDLGDLFPYEVNSIRTHAEIILSDFVYVLKRFADNDENIREACDAFDELIKNKNLCMGFKDNRFYVRRLEDYGKYSLGEEKLVGEVLNKLVSDLLKKALQKYDVKAVASDNIQTSNSNLLNFIAESLKPHLDGKRDIPFDVAEHLFDIIKKQNTEDGAEFFRLKSFDEVIQYISDYVESILVAERCPTKDEFRYIFGIIDKLKNDDRIKFFKEKSSLFRHFSEYVAESDKSSEEYVNSESTIQDRHAMYCAARFVDEMIICCQKDLYSGFLTRFLLFPGLYLVDHFDNPFGGPIWSDGILDFRFNKFKRPLKCHTAVIGQILKGKNAFFVNI